MLSGLWRYLGALALGAAMASPAGAVTYTFDASPGYANDFKVGSGGTTATFTSSSGPATFTVNPSADVFTFPVALGDFGNFNGDPLTITFSAPVVDRILIPFGVFAAYSTAPVTLVATTDTGQSVQFTTAFTSLISGSPQGVVSFVPVGRVRSVTLTSPLAFAIASVEVPEPMSATLMAGGLIMLAALRRRRSRAGRPTRRGSAAAVWPGRARG